MRVVNVNFKKNVTEFTLGVAPTEMDDLNAGKELKLAYSNIIGRSFT